MIKKLKIKITVTHHKQKLIHEAQRQNKYPRYTMQPDPNTISEVITFLAYEQNRPFQTSRPFSGLLVCFTWGRTAFHYNNHHLFHSIFFLYSSDFFGYSYNTNWNIRSLTDNEPSQ